jgi:hypothetical protein
VTWETWHARAGRQQAPLLTRHQRLVSEISTFLTASP